MPASHNDDVIVNKAATVERCVARALEEYEKHPATFGTDHTRQDAAILNIQRACQAALDIGHHVIRRERLGVPQSARDVFALLAGAGWIDAALADVMQRMMGFRNIAVHNYQTLQLPITVAIIPPIWMIFSPTRARLFCMTQSAEVKLGKWGATWVSAQAMETHHFTVRPHLIGR